jgi:hypothetical protein
MRNTGLGIARRQLPSAVRFEGEKRPASTVVERPFMAALSRQLDKVNTIKVYIDDQ